MLTSKVNERGLNTELIEVKNYLKLRRRVVAAI
jgi:hypothetical protein